MANGKIRFGKQSGGELSLIIPDGVTNTEVVVPESGVLATEQYVDGKYTGFKNYIINGNFDIWQRGTSHTTNATINYGSADRWRTVNLEATNLITTRQEVSGVVPFQAKYFIRQTVPLNTTTGTVLDQFIEGLRQFSNKVITLSMWVKGTAGKKICIGLEASYGTGGSPSINESILGSVYTLSGGWKKISITRILPDFINGKTYGTNGNDCLRAVILTQSGSIGLSPEIFFQSGTFDIAQVQLEEGSVATPFEQRPYGLELSLCQRYWRQGNAGTAGQGEGGAANFIGAVFSGSEYGVTILFDTEMRIAPSIIATDAYNSSFPAGSAINSSIKGITIRKTANSTANSGRFVVSWTASAEL